MPLSRRSFVRRLGVGGAGSLSGALIAARGREAWEAEGWGGPEGTAVTPPVPDKAQIRIDSNENPLGPGPAALEALVAQFDDVGRYPFNSQPSEADLAATLAGTFAVKAENVVVGAGSREILRNAVRAFASPERPFVTAAPSYEQPEKFAELIGTPVKRVPVDRASRLDLDAMASAAQGAGLVFVCNPNNPTATVHSARAVAEFVTRMRKASPGTAILIDEAYHDYVTDPAYESAAPLALAHPNVFITRTLSKAHGMAGLRIGYAIGQPETIKALARYKMPFNANVLGIAAAMASLKDPAYIERERRRNTEVRAFTVKGLEDCGYKATDSQANFLFVEVGRPAKEFREACKQRGVLVARDFPPLDKTHARISIGTMEEMRRACEVFRQVNGDAVAARR